MQFVPYLPQLLEGVGVSANAVNGITNTSFLTGDGVVTFSATEQASVSALHHEVDLFELDRSEVHEPGSSSRLRDDTGQLVGHEAVEGVGTVLSIVAKGVFVKIGKVAGKAGIDQIGAGRLCEAGIDIGRPCRNDLNEIELSQ